jgi:hypothetical protein
MCPAAEHLISGGIRGLLSLENPPSGHLRARFAGALLSTPAAIAAESGHSATDLKAAKSPPAKPGVLEASCHCARLW